MIHLYLKILEKFKRLILLDGFWVVHMPFVRMVKFQFLAQFPVDLVLYSFCSNLLHSLIIYRRRDVSYFLLERGNIEKGDR